MIHHRSIRSLPLAALTLFALCSLPLAAHAQSATATLSGTVEDQNKGLVPGAKVKVINLATGLERDTVTNDSGTFSVPLLPPSTYAIRVERDGFVTIEVSNIVLNVGDQRSLLIQMKVGDVKEVVNVTGQEPLINDSPAVGTVVDRQFAANIPLNGRSFQTLITLTPGVVTVPVGPTISAGQFSVNGQRASANSFTVDGVSANFGAAPGNVNGPQTGGNLPGLTTLGTTQSLVSVDALQEFKVQTSGYSAEYGRQPGGQMSLVTRTGGNHFHGSLYEYLRNDVLDANDWFANRAGQPRPKERQNDFGGTLSGPVFLPRFGEGGPSFYNGRRSTFFFFSYEGLRLRLPQFSLTNVPTLCLRGNGGCAAVQNPAALAIQPVLKAFPLPNGRDLGNGLAELTASYSDRSSLDATSIRVDHTVSHKLTVFGRYNNTPSESLTRQAGSILSQIQAGNLSTKGITAGATASLTRKVSNELRVNYTSNAAYGDLRLDNFGGAVPAPRGALFPSQFDFGHGIVGLAFPGLTSSANPVLQLQDRTLASQHHFNVVENFSYARGVHELKFGVDYRRLTPVGVLPTYFLSLSFQSQSQVQLGTAPTGSVSARIPVAPLFVNYSVYGQDAWRLSPRLTLEFGVRWEVNPSPSERNGLNALTLTQVKDLSTVQVALGEKAWKTTYNNFAPRFGLAYHLRQKPGAEAVVRGGFGVFYDTGTDFGATPFLGFPYFTTRTLSNITYPLSASQLAPPTVPVPLTPRYPTVTAFDPALKLPYTLQWSLGVEQALGQSQALTITYVGAAGRRLLQRTSFNLSAVNPNFSTLLLTRNQATSDYNGLQAQFQRRLSKGLQVLASYTWSHALDDDSTSLGARVAQRGNATFDVRHVFGSAVTYDIEPLGNSTVTRALLDGWSITANIHAQSSFPVDIIGTTFTNPADGSIVNVRPNVISGVPFYLYSSQYPGGRILNNKVPTAQQVADAGCRPLSASTPAKGAFCTPQVGQSGNLGRNQLRALGAWQVDFALHRQFKLSEKANLQFRVEAFNLFNHPNFGNIQTTLSAANFGEATNMLGRQLGGLNALYQIGGPRSLQFALRLAF